VACSRNSTGKAAARPTAEIVEADGRALRVLTQIPGILTKKLLPQVPDIKSMTDLLKPEFKEVHDNPYLAG
jgi:hypothetical protein